MNQVEVIGITHRTENYFRDKMASGKMVLWDRVQQIAFKKI